MNTTFVNGLSLAGAVAASGLDSGVAAHYGDPSHEQRWLESGEAVVDLSHLGVVQITGPDRLSWLNDLTSQELTHLAAGTWTQTLVLSPQGHVEHHLRLIDDGQRALAVVEPGAAVGLVAFLDRMRFLLRVEVADVSGEWAVITSTAPSSGTSTETPSAVPGLELLPRGELLTRLTAAKHLAGIWAYEALRIAAGQPRMGVDTDHRSIPNELGWIGSAVALDKGCYRGQETVARVHTLGRPPRRLTLLHLDGHADRLPTVGAEVTLDGRAVGFVGSSARHYESGPLALALLKRSVPPTAQVLVDDIAAGQEVVVDPEVGLHVRPKLG